MTRNDKAVVRAIYDAIEQGPMVLSFDEKRGVGVISLLDHRGTEAKVVPVAEITVPLLQAVNE